MKNVSEKNKSMSKFAKVSKSLNILAIVIICTIFAYCLIGSNAFNYDDWGQEYELESFNSGWYLLDNFGNGAGNKVEIEVPGKIDLDGEASIAKILPDTISEDTYLCFRSAKQDMTFSIDGEERFIYTNKNNRFTGKHSPVARIFVKIHPSDAGKELVVNIKTNSSYGGTLLEVNKGSQIAFWKNNFAQNGIELEIAVFMIIFSIVLIVIALVMRFFVTEMDMNIINLAIGMIVIFTWVCANSDLRQLLFPNLSIVNDLAYFMILIIPAPFLAYLDEIQNKRHSKIINILKIVVICDFFACSILHILKIVDFDQSFMYMAGIDAVTVFIIMGCLIIEVINGLARDYLIVAFGILLVVVSGLIQMLLYILHIYQFGGLVISVGMTVLLICEVYRTISIIQRIQLEKMEAIHAKDARNKFLANMSHEIRTPINSILGLNTMILRESKDEEIREYARSIQSSGKTLLSIINEILDFSKIDAGKMEIVISEYNFAGLINDIYNMINEKAKEKQLEFSIIVDEDLPVAYYGDETRIKQVLDNLLTNAVKYTHSGSVCLSINGECADGVAKLLFSVKDTGIGIKDEDLNKLTQEFVRIEESRNKNIEGTGLGINIVTNILQMMGSKLEVESVYGEGSNFYFTLEQKIANNEPIGDVRKRKEDLRRSSQYIVPFIIPESRLLVVDDNRTNRLVFTHLLKEMKCSIDEADSGIKCLEMVESNKYDIIFMDHMMPEMDGIETLHRIKNMAGCINNDTPIVILTANAINGVKEEYLKEGFDDYLSKPIDPNALETLIGNLIQDEKKIKSNSGNTEDTMQPEKKAELPYIDGVDWSVALNKLNSEDILLETVKICSSMAKSELNILHDMYVNLIEDSENEKAYSDYRIKVHSMKSSVATIGAYHLAGLAKYLEYAARDNDLTTIKGLMPTFEREWLLLKEALDDGFGLENKVSENQPTIDGGELLMYLDLLDNAMCDFDYDKADEIIEALSKYSYSESEAEFLEQLKMSVMNLSEEDCKNAIEVWNGYISKTYH